MSKSQYWYAMGWVGTDEAQDKVSPPEIRRHRSRLPGIIPPIQVNSSVLARAYRIALENENTSDSLHDGSSIGSIHAPASYFDKKQGK